MSCPGTRGSLGLDRLVGRTSVSRSRAVDVIYLLMRRQTAHPGRSCCKGYRSFQLCENWEGKGRAVARVLLPRSSPHYIKVDEKAGICITTYVFGGIVVTAARALSPKLHISYLDLCCLDARTLPLSSLGITLCI